MDFFAVWILGSTIRLFEVVKLGSGDFLLVLSSKLKGCLCYTMFCLDESFFFIAVAGKEGPVILRELLLVEVGYLADWRAVPAWEDNSEFWLCLISFLAVLIVVLTPF